MKIAISGKGGVGKTLLTSLLARKFTRSGYSVIAIDADPDANLAASLGVSGAAVTPISEMNELIEERTGAQPGQAAPYFKLNPEVDDIPEKYSVITDGIRLMTMGGSKRGGTGCYCPESALLKALVSHLLVARDEVVIMDMEAGIEHLGRGTAKAVDKMIIVVEPGRRSIETARSIRAMADEIGISHPAIVANKVRNESDRGFVVSNLADFEFLGSIPYDEKIIESDQNGQFPVAVGAATEEAIRGIFEKLTSGVSAVAS